MEEFRKTQNFVELKGGVSGEHPIIAHPCYSIPFYPKIICKSQPSMKNEKSHKEPQKPRKENHINKREGNVFCTESEQWCHG
jgi:hypothetical protein